MSRHQKGVEKVDPAALSGLALVQLFSFGSNMCSDTLRGMRKIHPAEERPAVLPGFSLAMSYRGEPFAEPGFGNLRVAEGAETHGALQAITPAEVRRLLRTEGGGGGEHGYFLARVRPVPYGGSEPVEAVTLVADESGTGHAPRDRVRRASKRYKGLLVKGARQQGLSPAYQRWLADLPEHRPTVAGRVLRVLLFAPIGAVPLAVLHASRHVGALRRLAPHLWPVLHAVANLMWLVYSLFPAGLADSNGPGRDEHPVFYSSSSGSASSTARGSTRARAGAGASVPRATPSPSRVMRNTNTR